MNTKQLTNLGNGIMDMVILANLVQVLEVTKSLTGVFVEVGCFNGSSSGVAMRYLYDAGINRQCYFFDVFDGFVYPEAHTSADKIWLGSHQSHGIEAVRSGLNRFKLPDRGLTVTVSRLDIIREELPHTITQVAVANIDVDLFEAVSAALHKIGPLVIRNGIIVVEDPGHTPALIGARAALAQFLRNNSEFLPIYLESGQTLLIRIK